MVMMAGGALIITFVLVFLGNDLQLTQGQDSEERPGVCPPNVPMSLESCVALCTSDSICPEGRKCCKTGCNGMSCKVPNEKPGVCPEVREANGEPCPEGDACLSDTNCKQFLKCCPSSCGRYICQSPQVAGTRDEANAPHAETEVVGTKATTTDGAKGNKENDQPISK